MTTTERIESIERELAQLKAELQTKPEPSRQTVLQELWMPREDERAWRINQDNEIVAYKVVNLLQFEQHKEKGYAFAPYDHRDWAEAIVKVRKGEWLPKKADSVFACSRRNNGVAFRNGKFSWVYGFTCEKDFEGKYEAYDRIFFPSEAQRTRFIESQKPKVVQGEEKEPPPIATINGVCIYLGKDGILRGKIC